MAHVNGAETVRAAAEAGMDSVEHGYFADSAALEAMLKNHVIWVPTLAATEAFIGREGFDNSVVRQIFDSQLRSLAAAREMGIMVASGSDSGAAGVAHGKGNLREYELLSLAGFTLAEIKTANISLWEKFSGKR